MPSRYATASTSSQQVSLGAKTFTVVANADTLSYTSDVRCRATWAADVWMEGYVLSYSGTTLIINVDTISGSTATFNRWYIDLGLLNKEAQGAVGPQGATGIGLQGITGIQGIKGITGIQGVTGAQGITGL